MTTIADETRLAMKGGGFLIEDASPDDIFTPEDFSEEQKMIAETTLEFAVNEILPRRDEMEHGNLQATIDLLRKAGELGLNGVEVPEKFGGLGLDKGSAMLVDR